LRVLARFDRNGWQKIGPFIMETMRSCPSYRVILARYLQLDSMQKEPVAFGGRLYFLTRLLQIY